MAIESWFPLAVYYEDLPDAGIHRDQLIDSIHALRQVAVDKRTNDKAAWTGDVHQVERIHLEPAFDWITGEVERHTLLYLTALGYDLSLVDVYLQRSWPIVSGQGQQVSSHAHHTANVSAVYYVSVPGTAPAGNLCFEDVARPNEVAKGYGSPMTGGYSEHNMFNFGQARYAPIEGRLIIFPAKQPHSVEPNESDEERISLSYDLILVAKEGGGAGFREFLMPPISQWKKVSRTPVLPAALPTDSSFEEDGYAIVKEALPESLCAELLSFIIASFATTRQDFVLEPEFRVHCPLAWEDIVETCLSTILAPIQGLLSRFLGDSDELVELSSITVFPGAKAQVLHPDEGNPDKRIVSVFINLTAVDASSGAFRIVPGSHRDPALRPEEQDASSLQLAAGTAVVMNSKTWHGGGANFSQNKFRPVFYFSFGEPNLKGPTYSIRPEVKALGKRLADFRRDIVGES